MPIFSHGIGIDTSDHHIRIAAVNAQGMPQGLFELVLPSGYIVDDKIQKPEKLAEQIQKLLKKQQITYKKQDATLLIPESRIFSLGLMVKRENRQKIHQEDIVLRVQEEIPISIKEVKLAIRQGRKTKTQAFFSVFAAEAQCVTDAMDVLHDGGFDIKVVESNNKALNRLVYQCADKKYHLTKANEAMMIVDIGHRWTNITAYDKDGLLLFSRSVKVRSFSSHGKGNAQKMTKPQIEHLQAYIQESLQYFQNEKYDIPYIVLAGVEALQHDIVTACRKHIVDISIMQIGDMIQLPNTTPKDIHTFGAAIGAALRANRINHYKNEHNFLAI